MTSDPHRTATHGDEIANYLARKAEVAKSDHEALQDYLRDKQAAAAVTQPDAKPDIEKTSGAISRRGLIWAGSALAAEAGLLAYATAQGTSSEGELVEGPQGEPISRELVDYQAGVGGKPLGNWIALLPTKLGGGVYALDLNSNASAKRREPDSDIIERPNQFYVYLKPHGADDAAIRQAMNFSGTPPIFIPMPPH
jgi:hypothetical protein